VIMDKEWQHGVPAAVDVTLLGRFYERYGDHAVSVAKRTVFVVTGRMPGYGDESALCPPRTARGPADGGAPFSLPGEEKANGAGSTRLPAPFSVRWLSRSGRRCSPRSPSGWGWRRSSPCRPPR
jgi:hypothetical protein